MAQIIPSLLLLMLLLPAVFFDVREFRIPNWLVFIGVLVAPVMHLILFGINGVWISIAGLTIGFCVAFPFWILGWMGAGDVKLIAAVGAMVGHDLIWPVLGAIGITGAFLAILVLFYKGFLRQTMQRIHASFALSIAGKKPILIEAHGEETETKIPYAIAISVGTLGVWVYDICSSTILVL